MECRKEIKNKLKTYGYIIKGDDIFDDIEDDNWGYRGDTLFIDDILDIKE